MVNILKKILSTIISLMLLMAVTTISSIFVVRNLLSGDNLLGIVNNSKINVDYSSIIPNSENNNLYQEIDEYIDTEQISEEIGNLITDYLKYSSSIPNAKAPNTDELKEIIKNSSSKYEEATGKKVNIEEINKQLDELEVKLTEDKTLTQNDAYKQVFHFIYNDYYIYIAIGVILVCIILILILTKFESLLKHLIAVSLFNGIGNLAFGIVLNKVINLETNKIANDLVNNLTNTFNNIAIVSFAISGVLLIFYIIIKIIKKSYPKKKINISEDSGEINNSLSYNQDKYSNNQEDNITDNLSD